MGKVKPGRSNLEREDSFAIVWIVAIDHLGMFNLLYLLGLDGEA